MDGSREIRRILGGRGGLGGESDIWRLRTSFSSFVTVASLGLASSRVRTWIRIRASPSEVAEKLNTVGCPHVSPFLRDMGTTSVREGREFTRAAKTLILPCRFSA